MVAVEVIMIVVIAVHDTHHISSADTVSVAHTVEVLVNKIQHLTRLFDAFNYFSRSIDILAVYNNSSAAEHTLEERSCDAFIDYLVEVYLVLFDVYEADLSDELCLSEVISCKRERPAEKGALLVCPDVVDVFLSHGLRPPV